MKNKTVFAIMLGLLASRGVFADEPAPSYFSGDEVVVTATKTRNSIADVGGSSVTVIDAEEIKDLGKETVADLLQTVPGVDIARNGGVGTDTRVYMRGADDKYTLLLIDGIRYNDPSGSSSAPMLSNLTIDNIERIEVVRGPSSMLYGSGASAGVINIITKKGTGTPKVYAGGEGGTYGTWKTYAGSSGKAGIMDYSFDVAQFQTDGFSTIDENNKCKNPEGKSFEHDGYRNTTASGRFGFQFNEHVAMEVIGRFTHGNLDYDPGQKDVSGATQVSNEYAGRVAFNLDYNPFTSTIYFNTSKSDRNYNQYDQTNSTYDGYTNEFGWQGDLAVADNNTVTVGVVAQQESMESTSSYGDLPKRHMQSNSIFAEDQWHLDDLYVVGGIRYEKNDSFNGSTTFRIAPSYQLGSTLLKCSYATGFLAPSLYQLYNPYYGNTNLKAQTNAGWDAGFEQPIGEYVKLGSTYFHTKYDDMIDFDMDTWKYVQMPGETTTRGVETFVEWRPTMPFYLTLNYTYLYTRNAEDEELDRRPRNKVSLLGTWQATSKWKISPRVQWVGKRIDSAALNADCVKPAQYADRQLDSYFLVDLNTSYTISKHIDLNAQLVNLFDADYEEAWGYATSGRAIYAGMRVKF